MMRKSSLRGGIILSFVMLIFCLWIGWYSGANRSVLLEAVPENGISVPLSSDREGVSASCQAMPTPSADHGVGVAEPTGNTPGALADSRGSLREILWPDFAHPSILESVSGGRVYHQVANHLLVSGEESFLEEVLRGWAAEKAGRRLKWLAPDAYLVAWENATALRYQEHKTSLETLLGDRAVVEPDWILRSATLPNDPFVGGLQTHFSLIQAEEAWAVRADARGIIVAVVDTGVDYNNPDLVNRARPRPGERANTGRDDDGNGFIDDVIGWNFVDNTNDPMDRSGHGTHVAGLIGAEGNNGIAGTGVAWDVTLLPVRFLDAEGRGTASAEVQALHYAQVSGARIINASYGGPGFSAASKARIEALGAAGIWVVAAAGNDGVDADRFPSYPAAFDFPHVISVGAASREGGRAAFSNYGRSSVDLFAPGVHLYSNSLDNGFTPRSGTSMAAPLVTGTLALILAEYPQASPDDVRNRLLGRTRYNRALDEQSRWAGVLDMGHALAPGPARAPRIIRQPESAWLLQGMETTLSVEAISSSRTALQWFHNGEPIPGATAYTLSLPPMEEAVEGRYHVRVRDRFGEVFSSEADIRLDRREPIIARATVNAILTPGRPLRLFVDAVQPANMTYQWFFNGEPLPGATGAAYVIPSGSEEDLGEYFVRLTNPHGTLDSNPMYVNFQPFVFLDWQPIGRMLPERIERKEGAVYIGHLETQNRRVFSYDLIHWQRLPHDGRNLYFHAGEYFLVSETGRIFRGTSPESLAFWVDTGFEPTHIDPLDLLFGETRLLVRFSYLPIRAFHLESGEIMPTSVGANSGLASAEGVFWRADGNPRRLYRSENGVDWELLDGATHQPLWEDAETGWVAGKTLSSSDLNLWLRSPEGQWTRTDFQAAHEYGRFPGGFFAHEWGRWFDFQTGELRQQEPSPSTGSPTTRSFLWIDQDRALFWERVMEESILVVEDNASGRRFFPFIESEESQNHGSPAFFALGDQVYLADYADSVFFRLRPTGGVDRIPNPQRLWFFGATSEAAYFYDPESLYDEEISTQIFRYRGGGGLLEFVGVVPADGVLMDWDLTVQGEGLVVGRRWFSSDGFAWEDLHVLLPGADSLVRGRDMWIATVRRDPADPVSPRDLYRRVDGSAAWTLVWSQPEGVTRPQDIENFFNGTHFAVRTDNDTRRTVVSSADGVTWHEVDAAYHDLDLWANVPGAGLFLAHGLMVDHPRAYGFASFDGRTWFPTDPDRQLPHVVAGGVAVYRSDWNEIFIARADGGPLPRSLTVAAEGQDLQKAAPASWTLHVFPERPEDVQRLELWEGGQLLGVTSAEHPQFTVDLAQPRLASYTVRAFYRDGWTIPSLDFSLRATGGLSGERQTIPGLAATAADFFLVGADLYARGLPDGAPPGDLPLLKMEGDAWLPVATGLPRERLDRLFSPSMGPTVFFRNFSWRAPVPGVRLLEGAGVPFSLPPALSHKQFSSFLHEGSVHLLSGEGDLYRLSEDGEWWFERRIEAIAAVQMDPPASSPGPESTVISNGDLHMIDVGNRLPLSWSPRARWITRDWHTFAPLPERPGFTFEGVHPDTPELFYLADDRRSIAYLDETGNLRHTLRFPRPVDAITHLSYGSVVASAGRDVFVASLNGVVWPIDATAFRPVTFWRDATRLGVFGRNGDHVFLAMQDFIVESVRAPSVDYGPVNKMRARLILRHGGGLSVAPGVQVTVRAYLEEGGESGDQTFLGEQLIDVGLLEPGTRRSFDLLWEVPSGVGGGVQRLLVEINADEAVAEVSRRHNIAASPLFPYQPDPPFLIANRPGDFGRVEVDGTGTRFPYGTSVRLEALPLEGFRFAGWEGVEGGMETVLQIVMDRPYFLRARFLPEAVAEAFPGLKPLPGGDWFTDPFGWLIAAVDPEWSFHAHFGWFYTGEATSFGAWLWFPGQGWRFRLAPGLFFDPAQALWAVHP